ncbi:short chain dehydrogenase [Nonomuraea aridisoli]|uniref:Short chain dehydrogenase n=1 Tax=Nonomuraea aridisoli TaxID=2070368 RepID=A0A2W2E5T8_9ACTN|nr:short chain dehydrogenase [Nonomuraea aridisoli]PZG07418.1 short chain dehydrogenase [Nonomuraea aridisoli]
MKVLVIGATGTLGGAVAAALETRHEVVRASRRGDVRVDMTDVASVDRLFTELGPVDAVVCCAVGGAMAPLIGSSDATFWDGLQGKLIGQVNLVRRALTHLTAPASVTLTSGRFPEPVPGSALGHLINTGLEAFVHAAAVETPPGVRLNVVSPGWIRETLLALGMDPAAGTPAADVARLYLEAIEGTVHGRTLTPGTPH